MISKLRQYVLIFNRSVIEKITACETKLKKKL